MMEHSSGALLIMQ